MDNVDFDPAYSRAIAWEAMQANRERERLEASARPFRFEDLNGRPEPESWGPVYPKTASAAVEKWRAIARGRELTIDEKYAHGEAVGAWIRALNNPGARRHEIPASDLHYPKYFTCAKLRARCRAAFEAAANAERRSWALGGKRPSLRDSTGDIRRDYARAMAAKRARLAASAAASARSDAVAALLLNLV